MFFYNLIAPLMGIALFSVPALVLELNLLWIGLDGMNVSIMLGTAILGVVCGLGALLIEEFDL